MRVILASASPRRREILARITYPFEVIPAHIDESRLPGESPDVYVRRMADEKARRISLDHPDAAVLGADTSVVLDGDVLGKPVDDADARAMLARLSGREHSVLTALAWAVGGEVLRRQTTDSRVRFRELSGAEIAAYVATGEPADKAGSYGIQAGASSFVRRVAGSITGVIGLPMEEAEALARCIGVPPISGDLPSEAIALRFGAVQSEVAGLAVAAGREARGLRLIAVSKGHPARAAAAAVAAGATDLGENYVQEGAAKREALGDGRARWHLIGPLQRNKVGLAASTFDLVHTIHRADLGRALAARSTGGPARVLVQVNVARDPAKSGVAPEAVAELMRELDSVPGLSVEGLMTIGSADATPEAGRAVFAEMRDLLDHLRSMGYERLHELSMGMSDDYRTAVGEGATLLRIGTAIFGPRPPADRKG